MGFVRGAVGGFLGATLANGNVLLFASGALVGAWADQTYGLPDVASELNRLARSLRRRLLYTFLCSQCRRERVLISPIVQSSAQPC